MSKIIKLTFFLCVMSQTFGIGQNTENYPYQNPRLSVEERTEDSLSRLKLEEKIGMLNYEFKSV